LAGLQDNVNCKETEVAEMRNQIEELQYEYQKILDRNYKLETHLADSRDKLKGLEAMQIDDRVISKPDTSIAQSSVTLQKVCGMIDIILKDMLSYIKKTSDLGRNSTKTNFSVTQINEFWFILY